MESPSIFLGLILKIFRRACVQCAVFKKSLPNSIYRQTDYHHVFVLGFGMSNKIIFKFWQTNWNIDLLTGIMFWNMTWFDPSQICWPRPRLTKEIRIGWQIEQKFSRNCLINEFIWGSIVHLKIRHDCTTLRNEWWWWPTTSRSRPLP